MKGLNFLETHRNEAIFSGRGNTLTCHRSAGLPYTCLLRLPILGSREKSKNIITWSQGQDSTQWQRVCSAQDLALRRLQGAYDLIGGRRQKPNISRYKEEASKEGKWAPSHCPLIPCFIHAKLLPVCPGEFKSPLTFPFSRFLAWKKKSLKYISKHTVTCLDMKCRVQWVLINIYIV